MNFYFWHVVIQFQFFNQTLFYCQQQYLVLVLLIKHRIIPCAFFLFIGVRVGENLFLVMENQSTPTH